MSVQKVEVEKRFCDVCGETLDDDFFNRFSFSAYCDGEVFYEYGTFKHDLELCPNCRKKAMKLFCEVVGKYFAERYDDGETLEQSKNNLLTKLKEMN